MDALALLCTLYAEGPLTLARLRQADCTSIESVLAADPRVLASILVSTEATAERFQREARHLGERVGTTDTESGIVAYDASPSKRVKARPAVLDRVLAAWREHDEHDADHGGVRRSEIDETASEREEILQPAIPARAMNPGLRREPQTSRTLAAGAVDGLDAESATALALAGVGDLRALALCDTLVIARTSGLSWSSLNRLRALAARVPGVDLENDEGKSFDGDGCAEEKISPSERPLVEHEGITQLECAEQASSSTTQAPRSRPAPAHALPMPTATTAPRYAARAPEGAGGPFA